MNSIDGNTQLNNTLDKQSINACDSSPDEMHRKRSLNWRPRVVEKTVKRYFLGGKGYAQKHLAYRKLAICELRDEMSRWVAFNRTGAIADDDYRQACFDFYSFKFPRCNQVGCCRDGVHDLYGSYVGSVYMHGRKGNSCRRLRWEWIRNRTRELIEEDSQ